VGVRIAIKEALATAPLAPRNERASGKRRDRGMTHDDVRSPF